jgi:pullulanase/glycogen debranching enzyme
MAVHDGFTLNDLVTYNDKHTKRTERTTATATITIPPGIAVSKGRTDDETINTRRKRDVRPSWRRCSSLVGCR